MNLEELEAKFIQHTEEGIRPVEDGTRADGVMFLCPQCSGEESHQIVCWKAHVPKKVRPSPGRWNILGTDLSVLDLQAITASAHLYDKCAEEFHIKSGQVVLKR